MRINVYSQELTPEVIVLEKASNTGRAYQAAQLILHSSERLHHPPEDDDRSAVTFWLPGSPHRREEMAQAFERIASVFRRGTLDAPAGNVIVTVRKNEAGQIYADWHGKTVADYVGAELVMAPHRDKTGDPT